MHFFKKNPKFFLAGIVIIAVIAAGFLGYITFLNYQKTITPDKNIGLPRSESPVNDAMPSQVPQVGLEEQYQEGTIILEKPLEEKSILMVIAFNGFKDREYFTPKQYFLAAGVKSVMTASNEIGTALGADGGTAQVNLLLKNVNVSDFDAIVFVGGPETSRYLDIPDSYRILQSAVLQGKLVSAISSAPAILAKAGVLRGKPATSGSDEKEILEINGAIFQNKAVVESGVIITANATAAVDEFSLHIVDYLMQ